MANPHASPALPTPPAAPAEAAADFAARLTFQADVSDVRASHDSADPGFVLVDSRGIAGWQQGHVPGAVHLPTADIPARAASLLPVESLAGIEQSEADRLTAPLGSITCAC
ncbi:rhodanese-like domain-containing protein [Streptomyces sp. NPDC005576]|uniref:rhodanese-like domain-containing protein n=1 Tax=Streptomyces sp. NPDC005576 TaxID=3364726 RepID=UPI00368355F8